MTSASIPHIPLRRCVGCGKFRPQKELLRLSILLGPAGGIDVGARQGGRGAYLCRDRKCVTLALTRHALTRALRVPQEMISKELFDHLLGAVS